MCAIEKHCVLSLITSNYPDAVPKPIPVNHTTVTDPSCMRSRQLTGDDPWMYNLSVHEEGLTKTLQWQNAVSGSYQNPAVTEHSLRVLPNSLIDSTADDRAESLTHRSYWSLCPTCRTLPKSTWTHSVSTPLTGALPLPLHFLYCLWTSLSHQWKGLTKPPPELPGLTGWEEKQTKGVTGFPSLQEFITTLSS